MDEYHAGFVHQSCAILLLETGFFNSMIGASNDVTAFLTSYQATPDAGDLKEYIKESATIMLKTLNEALESSSVFSKGSQVHVGTVSEEAVVYLGYLTSFMLNVARHAITPPMHLIEYDKFEGIDQAHNQLHAEDSSFASVLQQVVDSGRPAAVYSGESLFQLARTAESAWRDVQRKIESKCGSSGHALMPVKDLMLWALTKPQIVIPTRLDVTIYVVVAQGSYRPLGTCISRLTT
jgi:hypothetical protein